jgi:hypothetical protein
VFALPGCSDFEERDRRVLNIAFLAMASVLVWRFFSTGGVEMPRKMGGSPADPHAEGESSQVLPVHDA